MVGGVIPKFFILFSTQLLNVGKYKTFLILIFNYTPWLLGEVKHF